MAEKRYYWMRLPAQFFESLRIKKLRKMAGGDTYLVIYLKMQLKSINTDGVLRYTGLEANFADELALDLDESPEDVRVTLAYLISCGLVEEAEDGSYFLPFAAENLGSESASAQRVREHRNRKALQCNDDVTQVKRECSVEKDKRIEEKNYARTRARVRSYDLSLAAEEANERFKGGGS